MLFWCFHSDGYPGQLGDMSPPCCAHPRVLLGPLVCSQLHQFNQNTTGLQPTFIQSNWDTIGLHITFTQSNWDATSLQPTRTSPAWPSLTAHSGEQPVVIVAW